MIYGYIRVSTTIQNIDRQVDALKSAGVDKIFVDKITGTKANRPELNKMFEMLRKGDKVVVTELARFSRSLKDCISLIDKLNKMDVEFESLKETIDTTSPMGKFFFFVSAAFAQLERDIIVERTNEGIKSAKARGTICGRPKIENNKVKRAIKLYYTGQFTITEICEMADVSKSTLYKYLKSVNINKKIKVNDKNFKLDDTSAFKNDKINKAIKLYYTGQFTINEICEMADVSKSTLYKYLKSEN